MTASQFLPIYCGRSDGQLEVQSKKYGQEVNSPSAEQLDKAASPNDYYELLDHDHPITVEWKRQLGAILQRECKINSKDPWFLMFFPENYRLYNHVKDGRDAADAYLYGYPVGLRKRYRTALDFFPHLQWLMDGKSDSRDDCSCKNCAGEWVHKIEPLPGRDDFVPAQAQGNLAQIAPQSQPKPPDTVTKVVIPHVSIPSSGNGKFDLTAATSISNSRHTTTVKPAAWTRPITREQQVDVGLRLFTYRIGEIVWFNRGSAWGLALLIRREMPQSNSLRPMYLVQPLSHPLHYPNQQVLGSEEALRPWLAWSAPQPTHRALCNSSYTSVDWTAVLTGTYGTGDAEVDGSILAAKHIDGSYTLSDPLSNNTITTGERTYFTLYLGGEKLYVGDPVRLRVNKGRDVLVIQQIVEKLKPNSTNINLASVWVVGDVYRPTTASSMGGKGMAAQEDPNLPKRVRADLQFRNNITVPAKQQYTYWKLQSTSTRISVGDLKGRWYESNLLLPVIQGGAKFAEDVRNGVVGDVGESINGRGDANVTSGQTGTRYRDRLEAVGKAVTPGLRLVDEPISTPTIQTGSGDGDISQFMNMDHVE